MTTAIKIMKLSEAAIIPQRHSKGAAGYDLHTTDTGTIEPQQQALLHTGIALSVPAEYVGTIYGRSGLSIRHNLEVRGNHVYAGDTGEVIIDIFNNGSEPFSYQAGDRVAQIVFVEVYSGDLSLVDNLDETERGEKGWGSTGLSQ